MLSFEGELPGEAVAARCIGGLTSRFLLALLQSRTHPGFRIRVGRVGHQRHIVELRDALDGALVVFEAVLIVGITPLVGLDNELEGTLADIAPAHQLHHVVAECGSRRVELEMESSGVHLQLEGAGARPGEDAVDVVIEAHDRVGHVALIKGPLRDLLAEPSVNRIAPAVELRGITADGASGLAVLAAASLDAKVAEDTAHLHSGGVIRLFCLCHWVYSV